MKKLFIFLVALLLSIPAYSQGLFTLTGWELSEVPITGGEGKTAVAGYRIQYSSDFVAAVEFIDASGDTTTAFVRPDDSAVELPLRAYPSSSMIDSPYFRQIGSTIYYRNQSNEMRALVINPNDTYSDNFFTNADQFAINQNGEMVIIYGNSVNYRETNGTLHSLNDNYDFNSSDYNPYCTDTYINADASVRKFVFEWESGFMVGTPQSSWGDFQKWYMKDGNIHGIPAKLNAYIAWYCTHSGSAYDIYLGELSNASSCRSMELSSNGYFVCNEKNIYSTGDESTDAEKFVFPVPMSATNFRLSNSDSKLYASSSTASLYPKGLWRIDIIGPTATQINSGNNITHLAAYTDSTSDVVIFCGTRYSDSTPVIVQIDNADATPDTTEVESACNSLTPLH